MTKDEFLNALLLEGFICEKASDYPSVVCEAEEIKKTAKKVQSIAKDKAKLLSELTSDMWSAMDQNAFE